MSSCIKKTKMRGQGSNPRISKKLNLDDVCGEVSEGEGFFRAVVHTNAYNI